MVPKVTRATGPVKLLTGGRAVCWRVPAVLLLAVAVSISQVVAQDAPTYYCPGNILLNAGFENGFTTRGRPLEVVGNDWDSWFAVLPGVDGINYAPTYSPLLRRRDGDYKVHSGLWSQEMGTENSTHTGGLWQRVRVPRNSRIQASAWVTAWATNAENTVVSRPPGTYASMIGIDPKGGQDPYHPRIIWTAPITVTDIWMPLNMEVDVAGPSVTMFLRGQPLQIMTHNVSRWDSACLRVVGNAGEPTYTLTPIPPTAVPPTPGTPSATPNDATVEADALRRRMLLAVEATRRAQAAAPPTPIGGGSEPMPTLPSGPIALASPVLGPGAVDPSVLQPEGSLGTETGAGLGAAATRARQAVADNLGLLLLVLAALCAALAWSLGLRRQ
jgi:hypothetical protein